MWSILSEVFTGCLLSAMQPHRFSFLESQARGADGKLIAEGRQWTGFCNLEEDAVDKAHSTKVQPMRVEDEARKIPNTRFVQGAPFRPFAVRDGRLVTGQQGSSGALTAELVVEALKA